MGISGPSKSSDVLQNLKNKNSFKQRSGPDRIIIRGKLLKSQWDSAPNDQGETY